jgi:hypothetical protein
VHCRIISTLAKDSHMSNSTYNGWTNYATWRVNLEIFDGMSPRDITGRSVPCVSELSDALQEWAEEIIDNDTPDGGAGKGLCHGFPERCKLA